MQPELKLLLVVFSALLITLPGALPAGVCTDPVKPTLIFESIELKRRNWESHGTDINISRDGNYFVTAQFLGKSKKVREGAIPPDQLKALVAALESGDVFALRDRYEEAPSDLQPTWWGYELIIRTDQQSKTIRFHSEDKSVPEILKRIVDNIMNLTR